MNVYGYLAGLDQVHVGGSILPYYGTVKDAPFGKIDRKAFYSEPDYDEGEYVQQMIGYEFEHEFEGGWKISQNARYGHLYKHEIGPYPYGYADPANPGVAYQLPVTADNLLNRIGFEGLSKVDSFAVDSRIEGEVETGALDHTLLFGIDYRYYRLDQIQASGGATTISATNPVYGALQGASFPYIDQVITQQQLGIYAQDQIRFGNGWLVTLNGRYDHVNTDANSPSTMPFSANYDSNEGAWSGRAGLAYEFSNGMTPYVSTATFFSPLLEANSQPPFGDGLSFKPEKGYQFEGGVKYTPTFFDGTFTASVFDITKQNVLTPFATVANPFGQASLGEVRSTGFELEGKASINENWRALASFTYLDMEITKDTRPTWVGSYPMIVPKYTVTAWLDDTVTTGALERLSLAAGVRYRGVSWADNTNDNKVPGATVFDAAVRCKKDGWGAALNVANIFDKEYVSGCNGTPGCGYGETRTITLKLSKNF